jgi:RNA polymerase sigma-70 factor (ECF subfamily)
MKKNTTTPQTKSERRVLSRAEDEKFIQDALNGVQSGFTGLQQKYSPQITALVRRMIRNPDDVQDIVQDSFVKAFRALPSFNHQFAFSTWLYKIASNTCIDFLRKRRLDTISIHKPIPTSDGEIEFEIHDDSYVPDKPMDKEERRVLLREAINDLPEKYKRVIVLRHDEELEYEEIARRLELPLGTVKAHLFRAREALYKKLKSKSHYFYSS